MKINVVQERNGSTVTLQVKHSDTIKDVKLKLSKELKISEIEQELQYDGIVLKNNYTLFRYNISNGSLLHLWLKLASEKSVI